MRKIKIINSIKTMDTNIILSAYNLHKYKHKLF